MSIRCACIVGGLSEQKQIRLINKCPDILIGTVGRYGLTLSFLFFRLWWLFDEKHVRPCNISQLKHFVLDEADKLVFWMFSYPFLGHQGQLPWTSQDHQCHQATGEDRAQYFDVIVGMILRPSTTYFPLLCHVVPLFYGCFLWLPEGAHENHCHPEETTDLCGDSIHQLSAGGGISRFHFQEHLTHEYTQRFLFLMAVALSCFAVQCSGDKEKENFIYSYVQKYQGHTLIFVNSIRMSCLVRTHFVDTLKYLYHIYQLLHIPVYRLYAGLQQKQRINTINKYKANKDSVLLCTDVASRGIDIPDVTCVIHYHLPFSPQLFVHRSGRTARAGKEGVSILLVTARERSLYALLLRFLLA